MSFVDPVTIKEAVESMHAKKYLIPAIQREFVWSASQIEQLFDSLMRDYPISSFLFWKVDKNNIDKYHFYEFVRNYHARDNRHNPKASTSGETDITAILDGQQRLTSLYVGLKGTFSYKIAKMRWNNNSAFPERRLCINLLSLSDSALMEYSFKFLTKEEVLRNDGMHHWFVVGEILNFIEPFELNDYLRDSGLVEHKLASRILFKLHDIIHKVKSINFFLEKGDSLDKVLNIFVRINSGGAKLSHSDLLLSIATAEWKEKDAREEIIGFVDEINSIGEGFTIEKDFVLKSCLVLSGFKDFGFKVDNFNHANMLEIESRWEDIKDAIRLAVVLASTLGYNDKTLRAKYTLIPVALYIYKLNNPSNFSEHSRYENDRNLIFKWFATSLLKGIFGGQPDAVLKPTCDIVRTSSEAGFPLDEIRNKLKGTKNSLSFDDDEIANLLSYQYGHPYTFSTLASIYPNLDFRNRFHQDHIFPKKLFTKDYLKTYGINSDDIDFYLKNYDRLGNLQLLEGISNQEKSGKDFNAWIKEKYPLEADRVAYMERHYIPDIDLTLENFREFIHAREKLLIAKFNTLLKRKPTY